MKRILTLGLVLVLCSAVASAQTGEKRFRERPVIGERMTRGERLGLKSDVMRYRKAKQRAGRDGRIGPMERRKLHHMRKHTRRDAYRFRHNGRRRVI